MITVKTTQEHSRLNVRLSPEVKLKISRAAHVLGEDLTEFTSRILNKQADEVLENYEQILLSKSDYEYFVTELDKPAKDPSAYSLKARDSYREVFESEQRSS